MPLTHINILQNALAALLWPLRLLRVPMQSTCKIRFQRGTHYRCIRDSWDHEELGTHLDVRVGSLPGHPHRAEQGVRWRCMGKTL